MPAERALVAVLLRCEGQEYQESQAAAAREAAAKEGVAVEVSFANNSPVEQIRQMLALVNRAPELRPKAMIGELVGTVEGYRSVARAALSAGIGWVEVSGLAPSIPELRGEFPGRFVMSVTTQEEEIGHLHAEQCLALLPTGGSILYVEGPGLLPEVKARRRGLEDGLRGTSISIARTLAGSWTMGSAEKAMAALLDGRSGRSLSPALICAQNDEMAIGVRRVAAERKPEWSRVPFLGCDGTATCGLRHLKEGALAATVVKPISTGVALVQVVRGLLGGEPPRDIQLKPESIPRVDELRTSRRT